MKSICRRVRFVTVVLLSCLAPAQQLDPGLFSEMRWRLIGPFRAGRTVAVAGIPDQPNVFLMAPNNGGVWKTSDYGRTWNPIFDGQPTGSVGAMALAPSDPNVIYVGSGEGLRRPDLSTGDGIYKSSDGGKTWQHLGLRDAQQIGFILVDPKDPSRIYVAALGHPYGPNAERGVFRSTDGGQSWQKILYKDENTGAIDLAFDPANSQTLYAVMWASRRGPWTSGSSYNGPGSGLYKSTDGGDHWQQLTQGLPTWNEGLGRIGISVAPNDRNRMYALVDAKPGSGGLYRSDDAGTSWKLINADRRLWGRGDDFAWLRVDPRDADKLYVGNISTYRSTDGGATFTAIKGAPGGDDYHSIWINPNDPDIILLGVDQGATLTVNGGQTWSSWYNQATAQFYHVITDNQFPYWVYGGQQESGSVGIASRGDFGAITFRDWHPVGVEEYGYVAPDPLNPNFIYGGKVTRYDTATGQTQDVSPVVVRTGKFRFNRTAPLIFSPVDPRILYLGSNVLFKTTNGGQSWEIISPDLTRDDPGVPSTFGVFADSDPQKGKHRGVIYSLAPSPLDGNLIWAGTDDGLIHVTHDAGKTWQNVAPPELTPWSKIAQMDASHFDPNAAYAAVNRFRLDDLHAYIYRTHDGGKSWQKITTGIPDDAAVNTVREDPVRKGLLFAGTERTVYVSFDDGDHWQSLQGNLPSTSIRDLVVHNDDIVVGTHGRSFWILDNITPLRQLGPDVSNSDAFLFKPQLAYRVRRNNNTDTPLPPEEPAGQNPPDGAIIDYYLKAAASQPVVLEVLDPAGKLVRRYSSAGEPEPVNPDELNIPTYWVRPARVLSAEAGMHRWVWDLHYPEPDALEHEYPISAIYKDTPRLPRGPRALPGNYTVRLTVNGSSFTQPLTLNIDPRVKTPVDGLRQQFETETRLAALMHDDYLAHQQVKAVRAQLKTLQAKTKDAALTRAITALHDKAGELEGSAQRFAAPAPAATFGRLNSQLVSVYNAVDSADVAPTSQQLQTVGELEQSLKDLQGRWNAIVQSDIPELNRRLRKARLGELQPGQAAPR